MYTILQFIYSYFLKFVNAVAQATNGVMAATCMQLAQIVAYSTTCIGKFNAAFTVYNVQRVLQS
jgi:hypothetical protein